MTLLTDGTLISKADNLDSSSVSKRVASLPSSSTNTKQAKVPNSVVAEGEGQASPLGQAEDTLTLSSVILESADREVKQPSPASQTPETNGENAVVPETTDTPSTKETQSEDDVSAEGNSEERLEKIAEEIANDLNEKSNLSLRFMQDEETGEELFQLVEKESGDVVRQVPAEDILQFMKKFKMVSGLLFSEQA